MNPRPALLRLLLAACLLLPLHATHAAEFSVYDLGATFTDDLGRKTTLAAWRGQPAIVTMEYANCRFICSITLQRLKDVQDAADRAKRDYAFIVLSIDPKNDTPEAWTHYRKTRELHRDNWRFLTASELETPGVARKLGVKYWLYDGHIMHDFRLLRLDAEGRIVKVMDTYDADPDEFVR